VRRVDPPPALRHPPRGRGQPLIARAGSQRGHRGGGGLHQGVLRCSPRSRDAGDPPTARVGERVEVPCPVKGAIRHQGARAIGRLQLGDVGGDHVSNGRRLAGMATEWWHQQREPGLVLHHQVQHDLVEVGALSPAVAPRDLPDMGVGLLGTVVAAVDVETRAVQMRKPRGSPQAWRGGDRHKPGAFGHTRALERLQGTSQRVILARRGFNPRGDEPVRRCGLKKEGHEVQWVVHNAHAVQDHRLDGVAHGDPASLWVVLGGVVNDGANPELINHPGHQAEMSHDLTARGLWPGIDSSGEEILRPDRNYSKRRGGVRKVGCITHDVGETQGFDRVLVVEGGQIVEDGVPAELAAKPGSRYGALLEAEWEVREGLWSSDLWRRLRLEEGRLVEAGQNGEMV
jgi:hypothetical protein